jgi:hypothetical protein
MATVVTYQIGTVGSADYRVVSRCSEHEPRRYTSVSHGAHEGSCDRCARGGAECRLRRVDLTQRPLSVPAAAYVDYDDCLTVAASDVAEVFGLPAWKVDARWADDQRDEILVDVG